MITLAEYSVDEILPFIGAGKPSKAFVTGHGTFKVRMSGTRLECFRRNLQCVWCRRTGNVFLLQSHQKGLPKNMTLCFIENCPWCALHPRRREAEEVAKPHFNLYHRGKNGSLLLMTQDHVIPRSKGGPDKIENLVTMCTQCNRHKGDSFMHEFDDHGHRLMIGTNGLYSQLRRDETNSSTMVSGPIFYPEQSSLQ